MHPHSHALPPQLSRGCIRLKSPKPIPPRRHSFHHRRPVYSIRARPTPLAHLRSPRNPLTTHHLHREIQFLLRVTSLALLSRAQPAIFSLMNRKLPLLLGTLLLLRNPPLFAEPSPAALATFSIYARAVESRLAQHHRSPDNFLALPGDPATRAQLRSGQVLIEKLATPAAPERPPPPLARHRLRPQRHHRRLRTPPPELLRLPAQLRPADRLLDHHLAHTHRHPPPPPHPPAPRHHRRPRHHLRRHLRLPRPHPRLQHLAQHPHRRDRLTRHHPPSTHSRPPTSTASSTASTPTGATSSATAASTSRSNPSPSHARSRTASPGPSSPISKASPANPSSSPSPPPATPFRKSSPHSQLPNSQLATERNLSTEKDDSWRRRSSRKHPPSRPRSASTAPSPPRQKNASSNSSPATRRAPHLRPPHPPRPLRTDRRRPLLRTLPQTPARTPRRQPLHPPQLARRLARRHTRPRPPPAAPALRLLRRPHHRSLRRHRTPYRPRPLRLRHWPIALAMLTAFLLLSAESFLATHTLARFQLSQFLFGPTELRILLIAANLALLRSPYAHILLTTASSSSTSAAPSAHSACSPSSSRSPAATPPNSSARNPSHEPGRRSQLTAHSS